MSRCKSLFLMEVYETKVIKREIGVYAENLEEANKIADEMEQQKCKNFKEFWEENLSRGLTKSYRAQRGTSSIEIGEVKRG